MFLKQLYSKRKDGSLPSLVMAQNENLQSRFIVQQVLELREQNIPLDQIAVLFRSSFHSFDLEVELQKANIPFLKFGGYKFVETAHVKDMVSYLRVLNNPKDVVAWNRILMLIEGVGPRTSEKIIDDILSRRIPASGGNEASLIFWSSYQQYPENVQQLFKKLHTIASKKYTPGEAAFQVLEYYEPVMKRQYDDYKKRKKDIEMFQAIAERYKSIDALLTDLALEPPSGSVTDVTSPGKETEFLTLSTIHSAKGLEWHTVFVINALDGRFPASYVVDDEEELEEERRLMYVACTRAKENLYITYPINIYDRDAGVILTKPSRFIEGIAGHLLEQFAIEE
jgi:DNA helicase-2/ATP-dependent DNA helicase PcrA